MVEGGTLLRCYTSKRGIEGSNPSSSAPVSIYLQNKQTAQGKVSEEILAFLTNKPTYADLVLLPTRPWEISNPIQMHLTSEVDIILVWKASCWCRGKGG